MKMFQEPFVRYALAAGLLTGGICAYLGVYVTLKRIVFIGITVAEIAAMGIALGCFTGLNPTLSALAVTLIAMIMFWWPWSSQKIPRESVIGFSFVLAGSLSVVLVAKNPLIEASGVDLLSGNLLYATSHDLIVLTLTAVAIILSHCMFFRKLLFAWYDRETARTFGLRASGYELFIYLSIGLAVAVAIKIAGVIFVFASLVVPPLVAVTCCASTIPLFLCAPVAAAVCVFAGTAFSYQLDLPAAPTIALTYCILLILTILFKPLFR